MRTVLLGLLMFIGTLNLNTRLCAQEASEHIVVHLKDFDSEKNLQVYSLFKNDAQLEVINSCDVLGWIVVGSRSNSDMSKNEVRALMNVRLQELFSKSTFEIIEGKSKFDVMTDCRAEMQRQLDPQPE
jgi:hypothetical protein